MIIPATLVITHLLWGKAPETKASVLSNIPPSVLSSMHCEILEYVMLSLMEFYVSIDQYDFCEDKGPAVAYYFLNGIIQHCKARKCHCILKPLMLK